MSQEESLKFTPSIQAEISEAQSTSVSANALLVRTTPGRDIDQLQPHDESLRATLSELMYMEIDTCRLRFAPSSFSSDPEPAITLHPSVLELYRLEPSSENTLFIEACSMVSHVLANWPDANPPLSDPLHEEFVLFKDRLVRLKARQWIEQRAYSQERLMLESHQVIYHDNGA